MEIETPETFSRDPAGSRLSRASRKAALIFIFITVALDVLALGMIAPVLPRLVTEFLGGNTARAAEIFGIFATVWALMPFLFSPCSVRYQTGSAAARSFCSRTSVSASTTWSWPWRRL